MKQTLTLHDVQSLSYLSHSAEGNWTNISIQNENAELFTEKIKNELREMMKTGVEQEILWGHYVIGDKIQGINKKLIEEYIKYLGNKRLKEINLEPLFEGHDVNPAPWVDRQSNANSVKTDFFEARSTAYAKAATLVDDL